MCICANPSFVARSYAYSGVHPKQKRGTVPKNFGGIIMSGTNNSYEQNKTNNNYQNSQNSQNSQGSNSTNNSNSDNNQKNSKNSTNNSTNNNNNNK